MQQTASCAYKIILPCQKKFYIIVIDTVCKQYNFRQKIKHDRIFPCGHLFQIIQKETLTHTFGLVATYAMGLKLARLL